MNQSSITLGIARSAGNTAFGGQGNGTAKFNGLTPELRQKILERDRYTCETCGFEAQKYQDVRFRNGVAGDTRPENLAVSCIFCHQCFNLQDVATMRSGFLIWLPEISQADLHHIARAIYIARIAQGPVADAARRALDSLTRRREDVKARIGTDDVTVLTAVLKDYISDRAYDARTEKLEGVRLFPLDRRIIREADLEFNQFPQILAFWRSKDGPFGGRLPRQWIDIYRDLDVAKAA